MQKKPVYLSLESQIYRQEKADLLKSKAKIIQFQQNLIVFSSVRSQKVALLFVLREALLKLQSKIDKLYQKFPEYDIPKLSIPQEKVVVEKKVVTEEKVKKKEESISEDFGVDSLEKELLEINAKIKELAG
jgi:hypothetical protein